MKTKNCYTKLTVLLCTLFLLFPALLPAKIIDRVAAVVNDEVITMSDLNKEGAVFFKQLADKVPAAELETAMQRARQEVLDSLVDRKLIEQRAKELNISVGDDDLDSAIARILEKNDKSLEDFKMELTRMGSTEEDYRSSLADQILQSKVIHYDVSSRVIVTEEKIKDYYKKQYTKKTSGDGFHILQIGISWGPGKTVQTKEEAAKRARELKKMAEDGQPFDQLARSFSDLPSAADGGDIGVFKKNEMASYMKDAIIAMQPGDISPVLDTPAGFQIFKLLSAKAGEVVVQAPFESVKEDIKEELYQQELETQYNKWLKELRDKAYIKKLL